MNRGGSMDANTRLSEDLWSPIQKEHKDSEKIERPSLTFLEDAWSRLKRNKVSMVSMMIIMLIVLIAIFVPMFWQYSYDQQDLTMANIPSAMKVYSINDESSIYITPGFEVVEITHDGHLKGLLEPAQRNIIEKKNTYKFNDKTLIIDYSHYSSALLEYKKLEKKAKNSNVDYVSIKDASYLQKYYKDSPETETVSLRKAYTILESKMPRFSAIYDSVELKDSYKVRNKTYLMGTDYLGRDLFIRIVYGARISLTVGIIAAIINFVVGVFYGGISGYIGGKTDIIMMRIVDTISSIPMTLYVILIMVIVGAGISSIIIALGLTFWVKMARIVRGQVLALKQQEFVKAAIVIGADTKRIMVKHLIPNMMGPIMVAISMQIPSAIFTEAFLSFVGLGVSAPQASWGTLANDALTGIYVYPYQMFFPAMAISITILSFNLFSDGLRDALDPKLRK